MGYIIKHITDGEYITSLIAIITGFHSLDGAPGAKNLWFVYTLILIKIIYQITRKDKKNLFILSFISVIGTIIYNKYSIDISWAFINIFPAMLFFIFGNLLSSQLKNSFEKFHTYIKKTSKSLLIIGCLLSAVFTYILSQYNGEVWMYTAGYGNYITLFYLTGIVGSLGLYLTAMLFDKIKSTHCIILSVGSIIILTFHRELNHPLLKLIKVLNIKDSPSFDIATLLASAIVLLLFIPILNICKRIFPFLFGSRIKKAKV